MLHILCFLFALALYNLPIRSFSFFSRTVYRPFDLVFNMVFKVISKPASLFGCKMQPIEPLCKSALQSSSSYTHTRNIYISYIYIDWWERGAKMYTFDISHTHYRVGTINRHKKSFSLTHSKIKFSS